MREIERLAMSVPAVHGRTAARVMIVPAVHGDNVNQKLSIALCTSMTGDVRASKRRASTEAEPLRNVYRVAAFRYAIELAKGGGMKIAVAGKGGAGKTTIAGTLARLLARRGCRVWAIDADTNPNLAATLGIARDQLPTLTVLPRTLLQDRVDDEGRKTASLTLSVQDVFEQYGIPTPDGVPLVIMGRVDHAAAGCMCRAHAVARHLLAALLEPRATFTIVDLEAGLEHLTRGTARHVDALLVTVEPYYKALETARRSAELGRELGIPMVLGIANKIRDEADAAAVREYAASHGIDLLGEVPYDDTLRRADQLGRAPADVAGSTAVAAIDRVAAQLTSLVA